MKEKLTSGRHLVNHRLLLRRCLFCYLLENPEKYKYESLYCPYKDFFFILGGLGFRVSGSSLFAQGASASV